MNAIEILEVSIFEIKEKDEIDNYLELYGELKYIIK